MYSRSGSQNADTLTSNGSHRRPYGLTVLLMAGSVLFASRPTNAQEAPQPKAIAGSPGTFRMETPPTGRPWTLPAPGKDNACPSGDVQGLQWSPDGEKLVAEVNSGSSLSLCLFDMTSFSFDPNNKNLKQVRLTRISASAGRTHGAGNVEDILARFGGGYVSAESFPRWSPAGIGPEQNLAFVLGDKGRLHRAVGTGDLTLEPNAWKPFALDGGSLESTPRYFSLQPTWAPPLLGPDGALVQAARITLVTNQGLERGKAHLVTRPIPGDTGGGSKDAVSLTQPCEGGSSAGCNVADWDPGWDANTGKDRLAFIRADRDTGQSRLCIATNARSPNPKIDCNLLKPDDHPVSRMFPVFSPDGRYLVYNASHGNARGVSPEKGAEAPTEDRIEYVDLSASETRARTLGKDLELRLNPFQAPPVLCGTSNCWVLAVARNNEGLHNRLVALPLGGGRAKDVEVGMRNIKVVTLARDRHGRPLLALAALGYEGTQAGTGQRDGAFVMKLKAENWQ